MNKIKEKIYHIRDPVITSYIQSLINNLSDNDKQDLLNFIRAN